MYSWYAAQLKEEEELKDDLSQLMKSAQESTSQIADLTKQLEQLTSKWKQEQGKYADTLLKYAGGGGKLSDVEGQLDALISAAEQYINKRKQPYDEIDGTPWDNLNRHKTTQKTFGDKAKTAYDRRLQNLDVAIKAQVEADGIIRDYVGIAEDADLPEIVKGLQMKF